MRYSNAFVQTEIKTVDKSCQVSTPMLQRANHQSQTAELSHSNGEIKSDGVYNKRYARNNFNQTALYKQLPKGQKLQMTKNRSSKQHCIKPCMKQWEKFTS